MEVLQLTVAFSLSILAVWQLTGVLEQRMVEVWQFTVAFSLSILAVWQRSGAFEQRTVDVWQLTVAFSLSILAVWQPIGAFVQRMVEVNVKQLIRAFQQRTVGDSQLIVRFVACERIFTMLPYRRLRPHGQGRRQRCYSPRFPPLCQESVGAHPRGLVVALVDASAIIRPTCRGATEQLGPLCRFHALMW